MNNSKNFAITVLFYRENGRFELDSAVIRNPAVSDKGRIIIPDDFRSGHCIFAVLLGLIAILNGIGETRSRKPLSAPVTATVLYYSEDISLVLEATILENLTAGNKGIVLLSSEFRDGKSIICVVEAKVQLLNYMGQRALTSSQTKITAYILLSLSIGLLRQSRCETYALARRLLKG